MISTTLTWIILQELNTRKINFDNTHFSNEEQVRARLIEPPKKAGFTAIEGEPLSMWIVLDENPDDEKSGYLIIYNEDEQIFGLSTKTGSIGELGFLVGYYGSFVDTLENM